uniref:Secreted protein n=1 Tax=Ascaris lumbricoides TaxID=6252 RepID=A0A0M3I2E9_ASCLU
MMFSLIVKSMFSRHSSICFRIAGYAAPFSCRSSTVAEETIRPVCSCWFKRALQGQRDYGIDSHVLTKIRIATRSITIIRR